MLFNKFSEMEREKFEIENCQVPCKVAFYFEMFVEKCFFLMPVASKVILQKLLLELAISRGTTAGKAPKAWALSRF